MQFTELEGRTNGMWKYYAFLKTQITAISADRQIPLSHLSAHSARIVPGPFVKNNGELFALSGTLDAKLSYSHPAALVDAFQDLNFLSEHFGFRFTYQMSGKVHGFDHLVTATVEYRPLNMYEVTNTTAIAYIAMVANLDTRRFLHLETDEFHEPIGMHNESGFSTAAGQEFSIRSRNPRVIAVKRWNEFDPIKILTFYDTMKVLDLDLYREKGFDDGPMSLSVVYKEPVPLSPTSEDGQKKSTPMVLVARLMYKSSF